MQFWQQLLATLFGGALSLAGSYFQQRHQSRSQVGHAKVERIRVGYSLLLSQMGLITRLYQEQVSRKRPTQTEVDLAQTAHDEADTIAGKMYLEQMTPEHKRVMELVVKYREIVSVQRWPDATPEIVNQLVELHEDVARLMRGYLRKLER